MKYDLTNKVHRQDCRDYLERLIKNEKFIELKEIRTARSNEQNRYMHLLFAHFAIEYGETVEYVKQHFFKVVVNYERYFNPYKNPKTGNWREAFKSTASRTTKELSEDIERFRTWSSKECGIYLPRANEKGFLKHIEILIEQHKNWI